jgi:multidrug efflux system membrane fusion protein
MMLAVTPKPRPLIFVCTSASVSVAASVTVFSNEPSIVVPAAAVQPSPNGSYVYVVKPDRTAEVRPVTVARQFGEEMIIAQGLRDGEEVVTDGQLRLTPGAQVTIAGPRGGNGEPEAERQGPSTSRGGRGRGAAQSRGSE